MPDSKVNTKQLTVKGAILLLAGAQLPVEKSKVARHYPPTPRAIGAGEEGCASILEPQRCAQELKPNGVITAVLGMPGGCTGT